MKKNMGNADRMVRIIVGLIALGAGYYLGMNYWLMGIGAIILITGLVNLCPVYLMLGMSTASKNGGTAPKAPEVPSVPQTEEPKEEMETPSAEEPSMEEEAPAKEEPKEESASMGEETEEEKNMPTEEEAPAKEEPKEEEKKEM